MKKTTAAISIIISMFVFGLFLSPSVSEAEFGISIGFDFGGGGYYDDYGYDDYGYDQYGYDDYGYGYDDYSYGYDDYGYNNYQNYSGYNN